MRGLKAAKLESQCERGAATSAAIQDNGGWKVSESLYSRAVPTVSTGLRC